jgi:hypothetical protein
MKERGGGYFHDCYSIGREYTAMLLLYKETILKSFNFFHTSLTLPQFSFQPSVPLQTMANFLKHLKFVLEEGLVVLVEEDFVTAFNGFRISVNVHCKIHPSSKGNRFKQRT